MKHSPTPSPLRHRRARSRRVADLEEPEEAELVALQSGADDAVKAIGPLRIGIPLYNVYLNEADEWSRRLAHEVAEWALEPHMQVADSTVGAGALAGRQFGDRGLPEPVRRWPALFEAALQHQHMARHGTAAQGMVLIDAADELRRLLHQFAAGFLKRADAAALDALHAEDADIPSAPRCGPGNV